MPLSYIRKNSLFHGGDTSFSEMDPGSVYADFFLVRISRFQVKILFWGIFQSVDGLVRGGVKWGYSL